MSLAMILRQLPANRSSNRERLMAFEHDPADGVDSTIVVQRTHIAEYQPQRRDPIDLTPAIPMWRQLQSAGMS